MLILSIIAILWQYFRATRFSEVLPAIRKVGAGFGYILASTFTAYWLGTLSWWHCLGTEKINISKSRLFTIRHICETVGLFNPASFAGADMLKVVMLKSYDIRRETVQTSVIINRILMIASQLFLVAITATWLILNKDLGLGWQAKVGTIVFTFTILLLAAIFFKKLINAPDPDVSHKPTLWGRLWGSLNKVRAELYVFSRQHIKSMIFAFSLACLHWIVGSFEFYILLKLLGYDIFLMDALLVDMGVILVKSAGAFIPGQLGVEEIGNRMMLGLIGISSASLWLSVSVLRRSRQIFWILAGGVFYLFFTRSNKVYA
ncbi:lysylphosphatidylglycerol synthase transmembrane domain-containing protein [Dyadobacter luticola]|uniref:lysylphosphatidylglycerol synthase transmembrane domain-containing protein n=1 Tax=Dyadobacter luticola TaxID=1979387 RepID=UPI0014870B73|nr:lysylphosphatidylglycerol synthase transmembrane domain-containing protein [Dyadobacter luticola]